MFTRTPRRYSIYESGFRYVVEMRRSCHCVSVYMKLISVYQTFTRIEHVVVLADVFVLLFLEVNFVTAAIFVYTIA